MNTARARGRRWSAAAGLAMAGALGSGAAGAQTAAPSTPDEQLGEGRTLIAGGLSVAIASAVPLAAGGAFLGYQDRREEAGIALTAGGTVLALGLAMIVDGAVVRHRALARGALGWPTDHYPTLVAPGVTMVVLSGPALMTGVILLLPQCFEEVGGGSSSGGCAPSSAVGGATVIGAAAGLLATGIVLIRNGARGDPSSLPRLPALGFGVPGVGAPGASLGWTF